MINISRLREMAEKESLKAYIVEDIYREYQRIEWATSAGKAKAKASYSDEFYSTYYVDLRAKRIKEFDKYSDTKKVPIKELLELNWWFYCSGMCCSELNIDDLNNGNAILIEDTRICDFVKGDIICKQCAIKRGLINE